MEEPGLYLMYDMRWYVGSFEVQTTLNDKRPCSHSIYRNLLAVEEEVSKIKSRKNLPLLYPADELDGSGDSFYVTHVRQDMRSRRAPTRTAGPQLSVHRISIICVRGGHRGAGHIHDQY